MFTNRVSNRQIREEKYFAGIGTVVSNKLGAHYLGDFRKWPITYHILFARISKLKFGHDFRLI